MNINNNLTKSMNQQRQSYTQTNPDSSRYNIERNTTNPEGLAFKGQINKKSIGSLLVGLHMILSPVVGHANANFSAVPIKVVAERYGENFANTMEQITAEKVEIIEKEGLELIKRKPGKLITNYILFDDEQLLGIAPEVENFFWKHTHNLESKDAKSMYLYAQNYSRYHQNSKVVELADSLNERHLFRQFFDERSIVSKITFVDEEGLCWNTPKVMVESWGKKQKLVQL